MRLLLVLFISSLFDLAVSVQVTSKFAQKCQSFTQPALYFNQSCFIATTETHRTSDSEWKNLHANCKHLPGTHRRLAFIYTPEQIKQLVDHNVVKPNISLFVGSRKNPHSNCSSNCDDCPDPEQFYYVDETIQLHGVVNPKLWLRKQPDNRGPNRDLPEHVVAIEHANRFGGGPENQVGLNDVDGQNQDFPLLCEYVDSQRCPEGWTPMADGNCFTLFFDPVTPPEAIEYCENITHNGHKGTMPSIHDDATNTFLADMARKKIMENKWHEKVPVSKQRFEQYWPVMFGLVFDNNRWVNMDLKPTDYFRWWSLENKTIKLYVNPSNGHKYVYLMVRTNGDNGVPTFGYWGNVFKETDKIPFFFCNLQTTTISVQ